MADQPSGLRPAEAHRLRRFPAPLFTRHGLSLRVRLILFAMVSLVPVVCLGGFREFADFQSDQRRTYEGLQQLANSVALAVERDLQLDITALETLAVSVSVQGGDASSFGTQATQFLKRFPPGTTLALLAPDGSLQHTYGYDMPASDIVNRDINVMTNVEHAVISGVQRAHQTGRVGFTVGVPVPGSNQAVGYLLLWLPFGVVQDIAARQFLPAETVLSIADATGKVIARVPNAEMFVGKEVVPSLRAEILAYEHGVTRAPTLEQMMAVAAYTHVAPAGWAVIVGAPEDVVFHPVRKALLNLAETVAIVMLAASLLGILMVRGITRPFEFLRRLATQDGILGPSESIATGLPEVDMVAHALVAAGAERRRSADALAESEQRFRALFERSASGTLLVDPETLVILDCNEAAAAFLGYRIEEFKGRPIADFALRSSVEEIRATAQAVLAGRSWRYEARVRGKSGPRDLLNALGPVQVAGRTLILINQIDVTELRRVEAGLRTNEERLELAREGASLGIWDWNLSSNTLSWSDHQWRLHGLEPQPGSATIALWRQTLCVEDQERAEAELFAASKNPRDRYSSEVSVMLPDGSTRRLLSRGQAVLAASGEPVRMVGVTMDVTSRYQAEKARDRLIAMLEAERSRLSDIIEALPLGIGIVDAAGRVILGNALMSEIVGPVIHSMTDSPRRTWTGVDENGERIKPENFPVRRALSRGEPCLPGRDFLSRDADGRETWIRVGALPLRQEGGLVQDALAIFQDIDTEKRLLELQTQINARLEQRVREEVSAREAAQERAAHAERMHALGQIAGGVAHDFNNVLQAVSGGAALIERQPTNPDRVVRNARMVLDAARRGASITSRLLAFARRGDLRAESVSCAALLGDMAEVLTHTLGGSVICKVEAANDLPPLMADRGQLETVLVNMATNARDAMPAGGTLTLSADAESVVVGRANPAGLDLGTYIRLSITDTGIGMEPAVLARVTEPFFTTKEPGKGTGLGLAMAKGFAEQSGGSLAIESVVGRGTRVTLWLPTAEEKHNDAVRLAQGGSSGADNHSVLVVDDDAMVREVIAASLEDAGYSVLLAENAAAALARLMAGDPIDIVVSDLTMPGMNGIDLIRAIHQKRPTLPAVLLTGYAGDGAALAIGGAITGAFSLLRKPVSGTVLADRIAALLADRKTAGTA